MACLQERLAAAGVEFVWNTEVTGWRVERERHLRAVRSDDGGEIEADEFVVCGGSWSPSIVRGLGLRIPIQAGKGYSLTLSKPRELPNICAILSEARVAVTPMGGALRFAGTMEIAGLNEDINPVRVRCIIDAATKYYPGLSPRISTVSHPGADCDRALRMECRTWGAPKNSPISRSPPATR